MTRVGVRPFYKFSQNMVKLFFRIFYGLTVYGLENVPRTGRFVLVSNHLSILDPPLIGACSPREMFFAAKESLFKPPLLGPFMRYVNGVPIRRHGSDTEAIKKLSRCLREDNPVLIFPEGTRTLDPNGIEAKAGVGMIAMLGGANLVPARVDGTHDPKKSLFKRGGVTLRFGELIELDGIVNKELPKKENYRLIANSVMESIRGMAPDA
jgi:1-acyl-sn-glycerol-3-phosphate acyltransferase